MAKPWLTTLSSSGGGGGGDLSDYYDKSETNERIWDNIAATVVGANAEYATLGDALSAGKRIIGLKPGSYSGAQSITQDDVTIMAYGATWAEQASGPTFSISSDRVQIRGLRGAGSYDGVFANQGSDAFISLAGANGVTLVDVEIENVKGFAVTGGTNVTIAHSKFLNVATDPADELVTRYCLYGIEAATIFDCDIRGWCQAIGLWYVSHGRVYNNRLVDNYGYYTDDNVTVTARSTVEFYGEVGQEVYDCILRDNRIDGSTGYCVELADSLYEIQVSGNRLENFGRGADYGYGAAGAFVAGGDNYGRDIKITFNVVIGYGDGEETPACAVSNAVIADYNTFIDYQNTSVGCLQVTGGAGILPISAQHNEFHNCAGGIRLDGTHVGGAVGFNRFHNRSVVGAADIYLESGAVGIDVAGNQSIGGTIAGGANQDFIYLAADKCRIHDNRTTNGRIQVAGTQNDIHHNDLKAAGVYGAITIVSGGHRNKVYRNSLDDAASGGIGIAMLVTNSVEENVVQFNTVVSGVIDTSGAPSTIVGYNHAPSDPILLAPKIIETVTVDAIETAVPHGLGYAPTYIVPAMTSAGIIQLGTTPPTATNVYLIADDDDRTCTLFVM